MDEHMKDKICQSVEKVAAMLCLTSIAWGAYFKMGDPENVVINVIVGICAFVGGVAYGTMKNKEKTV
jgi:hypothetical protein